MTQKGTVVFLKLPALYEIFVYINDQQRRYILVTYNEFLE